MINLPWTSRLLGVMRKFDAELITSSYVHDWQLNVIALKMIYHSYRVPLYHACTAGLPVWAGMHHWMQGQSHIHGSKLGKLKPVTHKPLPSMVALQIDHI